MTKKIICDYYENPFQGMANDIPMPSLCKTIKIDLRQLLGKKTCRPASRLKTDTNVNYLGRGCF
ncbi:hypothetical protein CRP01_08725 [Flavilitoribacter nigricans DSM 23189 = NBRC 102662]|uniref:Uncharacterized protein n=1 Tax=Flavilitoribacter nigricans (strain ATCC 23147 / DSM 23189 / NBRC 102662 / NCIMB 1420 / SS-2) TaxID=1122177 RepID=A0A2D0NEV8_FLAN2|nr:hypothetical protein CRP01_08725 [Flavilitoribacter nigricans DSM 23189 = NBRC 102662]